MGQSLHPGYRERRGQPVPAICITIDVGRTPRASHAHPPSIKKTIGSRFANASSAAFSRTWRPRIASLDAWPRVCVERPANLPSQRSLSCEVGRASRLANGVELSAASSGDTPMCVTAWTSIFLTNRSRSSSSPALSPKARRQPFLVAQPRGNSIANEFAGSLASVRSAGVRLR